MAVDRAGELRHTASGAHPMPISDGEFLRAGVELSGARSSLVAEVGNSPGSGPLRVRPLVDSSADLSGESTMPQYFLSIVENESAYQAEGAASFDEVMHAHRSFAEAVSAAGAKIISSEALQPIATATYLRGTGSKEASVVDNPLPEAKEVVGGYYLVDAPDDETALQLAKLCPAAYGYIELRPIWDIADRT